MTVLELRQREFASARDRSDARSDARAEADDRAPSNMSRAGRRTRATVARRPIHFAWEDGPLRQADGLRTAVPDDLPLDSTDAGLADRLWAARETAEAVKAGEGRTRAALYQALSLAYDFAVAGRAEPRRLCRAARGIGREGAGARADDPDRQARLRHRLRQGAADRIRRRAVLCAAPGDRRSAGSRISSRSSRAASRRWSPPSARRAAPSRKPDTKGEARPRPASLGAADLARRRAGGRRIRASSSPAAAPTARTSRSRSSTTKR